MRIDLHDFSGHPFQAELSRSLAAQGHDVQHLYCEQYVSGKGALARTEGDADGLSFSGVSLDVAFEKYRPVQRVRYEIAYGREWIRRSSREPADMTIASNVPLISHFLWAMWAWARRRPWVFWHQDIYSAGLAAEARDRLPRPLGALAALVFERMERFCARTAHHVVAIGDGFATTYERWGVPSDRVSVIPNWAPLDRVFPTDRDNPRSQDVFAQGGSMRLLYAGTLGRKHNPLLLVDLLRAVRAHGVDASLTVVSEGEGADDLRGVAEAEPALGLRVLGFQPAEDLPDVLGSADVLVALLEPDATAFSIPSKVLSYMAAGRPILGLMPSDNPAAVDILDTGGHVGDPTCDGAIGAVEWLEKLAGEPEIGRVIGSRARAVAEAKFHLPTITGRFLQILGRPARSPVVEASQASTVRST